MWRTGRSAGRQVGAVDGHGQPDEREEVREEGSVGGHVEVSAEFVTDPQTGPNRISKISIQISCQVSN